MTGVALVLVALGAGIGAPARYLFDREITSRSRREFPWGTLAVNLLGSFLLGVFVGLSLADRLGPGWLDLLGVGFCGAFTTTSAFAWELVSLFARKQRAAAAGYVLGSVGLGLALAATGLLVGRAG